jgi:alkylation response protein AidB-like acyl-CoA dehydrogenase
MAVGLRAIGRVGGDGMIDRLGLREHAERALRRASRESFRAIGSAGRTFAAVSRLARPARPAVRTGPALFDLRPDDEQAMLREACLQFATERLRPAAAQAERDRRPGAELLAEASELGLTGLGVPEELGGAVSERSSVTAMLAAEVLAHGDMGLAVCMLAPLGVATALALWGDAEQQSTYLPAFAGEDVPVAALCLLEPGPLADPLAPRTAARADGGDFLLSGAKVLVPRAAEAELLLVGAEVPGEGPALFVVETAARAAARNGASSSGLLAREQPAMGLRAAGLGELRLEDVRVPARARLTGADYVQCVRRARLAWCALAVGTAQAVLDYVIPYVNERIAFAEPISHRQSVAFMVSDIAIELEGMRLATLRAASRADAGRDFAREVAVARALCSEQGARIGSDGVQLLGGHGYVTDHPVERWYRDLRAVGVMEGALLL